MVEANTKCIAKQSIHKLFLLANEAIREDHDLAQRYVDIARKIAMAAKVHLPAEYKRQVCRKCKSFILPGVNCRVRTKRHREPHVVITCLKCGKHTRIPFRRRTKA